jgi:protein gp37
MQLLSTRLQFAAKERHIWWGVSVEDRRYGLPRIEHLRMAPAHIKFLSIEPLLEDLGRVELSGIHWAIVGGESGHGARPMKEQWVQNILQICTDRKVPFFFKQWGGVHKSAAGRTLNGRAYDDMPKRVVAAIPPRKIRLSMAADWKTRAQRWQSSAMLELVTLQPAAACP